MRPIRINPTLESFNNLNHQIGNEKIYKNFRNMSKKSYSKKKIHKNPKSFLKKSSNLQIMNP